MCGIWAIFGSEADVSRQCYSCTTIAHRGPDAFRIENVNHFKNCCFGFHRLAIVDDLHGMQPMRVHSLPHLWLCYNGEIYNYKQVRKQFDFDCLTECDGEVILHLYARGGIEFAAQHLDGVYAFCLLDVSQRKVFIGRDLYGVRPCFRMHTSVGFMGLSSEAKGLMHLCHDGDTSKIEPLEPGTVETYALSLTGKISFESKVRFQTVGNPPIYTTLATPEDYPDVSGKIRHLLTAAVKKRLMGQRRIGCMLSGGLDSSLIAGLLTQLLKEEGAQYQVQTFSIGMEGSPDVIAAKKVAKHIGSEHHEIVFSAEEGIDVLDKVIYHLETYDITTIRASVGMYLISKYIATRTDSVVIFSGEGADELAEGYIYFHKAPSAAAADAECRRLLRDLYMYDNLRADRTTAAHGLELRVPFLDHQFVSFYLSLPAEDRLPRDGVEKFLLRDAFAGTDLIPTDILWRPKEAFSDGVSSQKRSWFEVLQEHIDGKVTDEELKAAPALYPFNAPQTKEALFYRQIFEKYYLGEAKWISYPWMPRWVGEVNDPSARTLKHYKP